jgi:quercetin dioxygenase-like cupin family protein
MTMLTSAVALAAFSIAAAAYAQSDDVITRSALEWREMIPGVSFAPAYGDWEKGAHAKYVQISNSAKIPLHTHSSGYHAVLVSGRMANLYDGGQRAELSPGDHFHMAARRPHSHQCLSEEPCFFYTHSAGSWDLAVHEGK